MSAAVLERPDSLTITAVDDDCDTCFGRGEIYAKPGVFKPCPACCGGFTAAVVRLAPVVSPATPCPGCGCSLSTCVPGGCGHSCCCC